MLFDLNETLFFLDIKMFLLRKEKRTLNIVGAKTSASIIIVRFVSIETRTIEDWHHFRGKCFLQTIEGCRMKEQISPLSSRNELNKHLSLRSFTCINLQFGETQRRNVAYENVVKCDRNVFFIEFGSLPILFGFDEVCCFRCCRVRYLPRFNSLVGHGNGLILFLHRFLFFSHPNVIDRLTFSSRRFVIDEERSLLDQQSTMNVEKETNEDIESVMCQRNRNDDDERTLKETCGIIRRWMKRRFPFLLSLRWWAVTRERDASWTVWFVRERQRGPQSYTPKQRIDNATPSLTLTLKNVRWSNKRRKEQRERSNILSVDLLHEVHWNAISFESLRAPMWILFSGRGTTDNILNPWALWLDLMIFLVRLIFLPSERCRDRLGW